MLLAPLLLAAARAAADLTLENHADLSASLAAVAAAHADVASVVSFGVSREGRALEGLRLAGGGSGGGADGARPAILVVANLEGPDVFDSAVALDHARRLAEGYGNVDAVTAFLDRTTVYVLPRANPDAAEARFRAPRFEREAGGRGVDNDRDGRAGEDGPADVDGDGVIVSMRALDPEGTWILDPTDPRALVEADRKKGERGLYRLYVEGRDADGDERVAEDPEHDTRLNRNFASGWTEHGADAGLFPGDEPEARALMELVLLRDELALVLCYGAPDNLVGKPKTVKDDAPARLRVPAEGILESDADLLAEIGERYKDTTGNEAQGAGDDAGTFQRWCYDHRGLLVLGTVLWEPPLDAQGEAPKAPASDEAPPAPAETRVEHDATDEAHAAEEVVQVDEADAVESDGSDESDSTTDAGRDGKDEPKDDAPKPSDQAKRLKWIDASGEDWRFVEWKPFEHPELGPVEIGGIAPYALREPPEDEWDEIAAKHFDFLMQLGDLLPRVRLAECSATGAGANLWRVTVVLENDALLPLQSHSALRTRTIRPAKLRLALPTDAKVLAGPEQVLVSELPGSGGRHEESWLVSTASPGAIEARVDTDNAGGAVLRAEVKP